MVEQTAHTRCVPGSNPGAAIFPEILMVKIKDKILAAIAYAFGVPALYLILSSKRKDEFLRHHGDQAFFLWVMILVLFFFFRFIGGFFPALNLIELALDLGLWAIALYYAVKTLRS